MLDTREEKNIPAEAIRPEIFIERIGCPKQSKEIAYFGVWPHARPSAMDMKFLEAFGEASRLVNLQLRETLKTEVLEKGPIASRQAFRVTANGITRKVIAEDDGCHVEIYLAGRKRDHA